MQPLLGDGWGRGSPVSHASSASTDSSCVDGASHTKGDAKDDAAGSGAGAAHSRPPWPWPISAVLPNEVTHPLYHPPTQNVTQNSLNLTRCFTILGWGGDGQRRVEARCGVGVGCTARLHHGCGRRAVSSPSA